MRVVALDLSLTSCGWARSLAEPPALGLPWESGVFNLPHRGVRRLQHGLTWIVDVTRGADLVVIEAYAHNKKLSAHRIGEFGGVARLGIYQAKIPFMTIAPNQLKKVALGVGKGSKEAVLAEAVRRLDYQGSSTDEADALWMLQAALQWYGLPGARDLPKAHTELLGNIKWPDVGALVG